MKISNLLKKFSKKPPASTPEKSAVKNRKPRAPRVRLSTLHHLNFEMLEPNAGEKLSIANISTSGIGLNYSPIANQENGTSSDFKKITGELLINGVRFRMIIEVVRRSENFLGGRFESPSHEMILAINRYFDAEIAAVKLTSMPSGSLKEEPLGTPHFFHGSDNCELFYVSEVNEVLRFNLTVFGIYIEGGKGLPFFVGSVDEDNKREKPNFRGSTLIQRKNGLDPETFTRARRMIQGIESIDPHHREAILAFLSA